MPVPKNKEDLQRLLGMLAYVNKFVKNISDVTEPFRNLLKKNVIFTWYDEHQQAFEKLKQILTCTPVLQFFDVKKETIISVDASKTGLGAVLLQNNLPCAYASKSMSETQIRYAQIEKELLAICFGVMKFHNYVFGKKFIIENDHQPLIPIFKKTIV